MSDEDTGETTGTPHWDNLMNAHAMMYAMRQPQSATRDEAWWASLIDEYRGRPHSRKRTHYPAPVVYYDRWSIEYVNVNLRGPACPASQRAKVTSRKNSGAVHGRAGKYCRPFSTECHKATSRVKVVYGDDNSWIGAHFIGFWVSSMRPELLDLGTIDLGAPLAAPKYQRAYDLAVKHWAAFAKWVHDERGIALDTPKLWLVECQERAAVKAPSPARRLPSDIGRIAQTDGVVGGRPVIAGTRIEPKTIMAFLRAGATVEQLLQEYPTLTAADVAVAQTAEVERDAWLRGFAMGLAEMHRALIFAGHDAHLVSVARSAGLTLADAARVGVDAHDIDELRSAGVT